MCWMASPVCPMLLVAAVLNRCVHSQTSSVVISTSTGSFRGTSKNILINGRQIPVETYWGIPYALPPTGERRFKRPEPITQPSTTVYNATVPPKACLQDVWNRTIRSLMDTSEDCLYFNVWRPRCNISNMATLVHIHGGSLRSGSSTNPLYKGENLAAAECVLVMSFNYRLGALGFLHVDTPGFHSNAGLYDVKHALLKIKNEVSSFSGNRDKITVFGSGAGAFLASTFVFSDDLRDSVNNVILQSGSPTMQMLYQSRTSAMTAAKRLGTDLQCNTDNMTLLVSCLRQADAHVLMQSFFKKIDGFQYRMVTVMDDGIMKKDPFDYLENQDINNISVIVGTNKDEATETLMKILPRDFNRDVSQPPVFSDRKMSETLRHFLGILYKPPYLSYATTLVNILYDYDKMKLTDNSSLAFLSPLALDIAYTCPMRTLIEAYAGLPNDVYVYSFNHGPDNTSLPAWVGATHRAEIPYIFRTSNRFSPREIALSERMQRMWANFARYGTPTPGNTTRTQWPVYSWLVSEQMMVFTENARFNVSEVPGQNCPFWNTIPDVMKIFP